MISLLPIMILDGVIGCVFYAVVAVLLAFGDGGDLFCRFGDWFGLWWVSCSFRLVGCWDMVSYVSVGGFDTVIGCGCLRVGVL